jgi:hypothetical protein
LTDLLRIVVETILTLLVKSTGNTILVLSTGAALCGLSFTAGTILLRRPLSLSRESAAEKWLTDFLGRAYSLAIDTNFHKVGSLVRRYLDEFVYHEFPNFGVDRYSGIVPRTRPSFDFGKFLSSELGSSMTVNDKPEPFEREKMIEITTPIARIWRRTPFVIRRILTASIILRQFRYNLFMLNIPNYGRSQYVTVSYRLYPSKEASKTDGDVDFEVGISAEWSYDDIKNFEGTLGRMAHFVSDIKFYIAWGLLLVRTFPSLVRNWNDFTKFFLSDSKRARATENLIMHRLREIRSLHQRILFSRPEGLLTQLHLAAVTFVFDRDIPNHVEIYLTDSELQLVYSLRRFATSMLRGAIVFGVASVIAFADLLISGVQNAALITPVMGALFYFSYLYGWYILLRGLVLFGRYFILAKRREIVSYSVDLRCPSCNAKISADLVNCKQCGEKLSTLPPQKPKITLPPPAELDKLSVARWERFAASARAEYEGEISRIRKTISFRVAKEADYQVAEFKQFGQRFLVGPQVLVDAYSAGDTYTAPEIFGLGRNVAIAQEKHLVDVLLKGISNRMSLKEFTADTVTDAIQEVGIRPDTVFLPLDYFSPVAMSKVKGISLAFEGRDEFLLLGKMRLRVLWSNKYVPFSEMIFVEKNLGEWLVKPDQNSHWLRVELAPGRTRGKFDVTIKTIAEYVIDNPAKGLVIEMQNPSSQDLQNASTR